METEPKIKVEEQGYPDGEQEPKLTFRQRRKIRAATRRERLHVRKLTADQQEVYNHLRELDRNHKEALNGALKIRGPKPARPAFAKSQHHPRPQTNPPTKWTGQNPNLPVPPQQQPPSNTSGNPGGKVKKQRPPTGFAEMDILKECPQPDEYFKLTPRQRRSIAKHYRDLKPEQQMLLSEKQRNMLFQTLRGLEIIHRKDAKSRKVHRMKRMEASLSKEGKVRLSELRAQGLTKEKALDTLLPDFPPFRRPGAPGAGNFHGEDDDQPPSVGSSNNPRHQAPQQGLPPVARGPMSGRPAMNNPPHQGPRGLPPVASGPMCNGPSMNNPPHQGGWPRPLGFPPVVGGSVTRDGAPFEHPLPGGLPTYPWLDPQVELFGRDRPSFAHDPPSLQGLQNPHGLPQVGFGVGRDRPSFAHDPPSLQGLQNPHGLPQVGFGEVGPPHVPRGATGPKRTIFSTETDKYIPPGASPLDVSSSLFNTKQTSLEGTHENPFPPHETETIRVYIAPSNYPIEFLTDEQMDTIEDNILSAVMNAGGRQPSFLRSSRGYGRFQLTCADPFSHIWLGDHLHHLCPNVPLRIVIPDCTKMYAIATLPLCKFDDNGKIMKFITNQNKGLNVREWTLLVRRDNDIKNTSLGLAVDVESANVLKHSGRINFKMGSAEIKIVGDGDEHEQISGLQPSGFEKPVSDAIRSSSHLDTRIREREVGEEYEDRARDLSREESRNLEPYQSEEPSRNDRGHYGLIDRQSEGAERYMDRSRENKSPMREGGREYEVPDRSRSREYSRFDEQGQPDNRGRSGEHAGYNEQRQPDHRSRSREYDGYDESRQPDYRSHSREHDRYAEPHQPDYSSRSREQDRYAEQHQPDYRSRSREQDRYAEQHLPDYRSRSREYDRYDGHSSHRNRSREDDRYYEQRQPDPPLPPDHDSFEEPSTSRESERWGHENSRGPRSRDHSSSDRYRYDQPSTKDRSLHSNRGFRPHQTSQAGSRFERDRSSFGSRSRPQDHSRPGSSDKYDRPTRR